MEVVVRRPRDSEEFMTPEGCWILESWNDETDPAVSIARARVAQCNHQAPSGAGIDRALSHHIRKWNCYCRQIRSRESWARRYSVYTCRSKPENRKRWNDRPRFLRHLLATVHSGCLRTTGVSGTFSAPHPSKHKNLADGCILRPTRQGTRRIVS